MVFDNLNSLETLSLQNNKLTRVPEDITENILDTLRAIDITDNPLYCECELSWYAAWLKGLHDMDDEVMSKIKPICTMVSEHREYPVQTIPLKKMGCVGKNVDRATSLGTGVFQNRLGTFLTFVSLSIILVQKIND
ncbi:leucine-rich repeat LGI family member 3-like [Leptopilina boulardi]|uniref:leucine-rich repeat LGI family member 3-like n=1 Tax=Leptopilina boulardi TaxID=63433 RepID=UPI0021F5BAE1|nr:leucine-rich repeat LGI family member 3-like [Leptopilina boulardi]